MFACVWAACVSGCSFGPVRFLEIICRLCGIARSHTASSMHQFCWCNELFITLFFAVDIYEKWKCVTPWCAVGFRIRRKTRESSQKDIRPDTVVVSKRQKKNWRQRRRPRIRYEPKVKGKKTKSTPIKINVLYWYFPCCWVLLFIGCWLGFFFRRRFAFSHRVAE